MGTAGPEPLTHAPDGWPASGHVRVAVVGAGFGGLGTARELVRAGIEDLVVLDRGTTVGGTWRDNTYPGCGCDVPSHLYSYSFAPNREWSRSYSRQPEIHRYLQGVARDEGLERFLVTGVEVLAAHWDDAAAHWRIGTDRGDLTADLLVAATGPLVEPSTPALPGLAGFPGPVFHTARWRHDVDLRGKRVGIVGTGASSVQVAPQIAPVAGRTTIFQRTPPWVIPKADRRLSGLEHALYRRFPALTRLPRLANYLFREAQIPGFVVEPGLMRLGETVAKAHLARQVRDPELRRVLTPDYRLGCKRVTPSNQWYPTLVRDDVDLVPSALTGFEGSTAIAADGSRHELDAVVFGTGFEVGEFPVTRWVHGRDGRSLRDVWHDAGHKSALRGTTVAGFPNLFLILGPNTGLGHSSMVYVIESQVAYVVDAVRAMTAARLAAIEPLPGVQAAYHARLQRRMARTVWTRGGCASWYQDADGGVTTLWPGSTLHLRHDTRRVDLSEYDRRLTAPTGSGRPENPRPRTISVTPSSSFVEGAQP